MKYKITGTLEFHHRGQGKPVVASGEYVAKDAEAAKKMFKKEHQFHKPDSVVELSGAATQDTAQEQTTDKEDTPSKESAANNSKPGKK